ncbi:MAG: ParB/RepB/Spo0J family partition protein [Firmicutes bacterium]|nr:ParB/RepB/Spo0J family partition protein [Bacillota bacterium]
MQKRKSTLGKGLGALFEQVEEVKRTEVHELELNKIIPNPEQVRKDFDEEAIDELAKSIENHGLLEPILVTPRGDKFLIVAGERRFRAYQKLKKKSIPALVKEFLAEDIKKLSLIENIQRKDLNPIEEAMSYKELMDELELTQEELAHEIGKSRSHIANSLRLLKLDKSVCEMVRRGDISFGHAKILSSATYADQIKYANSILSQKLSVRDFEELFKEDKKSSSKKKNNKNTNKNMFIEEIENQLIEQLLARVSVRYKDGKGKIIIDFSSDEELNRLINYIGRDDLHYL